MYEKVSPMHVDKICDRIAGAIVDLAYRLYENPRVAVEILLGHGKCYIIAETNVHFENTQIESIVHRIAGEKSVYYTEVPQDAHLALNQSTKIRCGDNGIFKGMPVTDEQKTLTVIAKDLYKRFPFDGKYILDGDKLIICQSNAKEEEIKEMYPDAIINPLGFWTGGSDVDTGAVNRKLGSDMGDSVTGSGLWSKDLSKADISVNVYAWLKAQETGKPVEISCAIGDEYVDGKPYSEIVKIAKEYIDSIGGFEKFAEWGLIR